MTKKELYRRFCQNEPGIPFFSKDWWLDAVCGEGNWNVAVNEKDGQIIGSLPFYLQKNKRRVYLVQPPLTQNLGPWIRNIENENHSARLSREKKIMNSLIKQLPVYDYFCQNWHYSNTNWLPFYWKGFEQKTYYTYVLSNLRDEDYLWSNLDSKIRTDIKKAINRYHLVVKEDGKIDDLYRVVEMTFARQGKKPQYTIDTVRRVHQVCSKHDSCRLLTAEDDKNQVHSAIYITWDNNSVYYLMGGGDPKLRNSGANSLLIWEAIKFASKFVDKFDFEGSMVESVERYFRAFGATQTPYFNISHIRSPWLRLKRCLSSVKN